MFIEITEYDLADCACDDDYAQAVREAFETGDLTRQLDEVETLLAMEALSC